MTAFFVIPTKKEYFGDVLTGVLNPGGFASNIVYYRSYPDLGKYRRWYANSDSSELILYFVYNKMVFKNSLYYDIYLREKK